ncbi:unnamed protein product [Ceutorhynchus assimilis]|uniref:RING-type domain-containing protein n=1 Tax=Ceutorhynchus assimilis TaxID=467358 RepID=A0A9N9MTX1_9CUCU|nr:unnamed protein product [Ceutorhynchus assimilis]
MENLAFIKEIFPFKSEQQIREIIELVEQGSSSDSAEQKLENIYNMLFGDGQNGLNGAQAPVDTETLGLERFFHESDDDGDDEGAVGYCQNNDQLSGYLNQLQSVFPDASEEFLWDFCRERSRGFDLNTAIDDLTRDGYDRKIVDADFIWNRLKDALPEADPSYLKIQAERLVYEEPRMLEEFVNEAYENNDYPTMESYVKRKQEEDILNIYKENYQLDKFLKKFMETFADPEKHFKDPDRQKPLQQPDTPEEDFLYARTFLYNQYPYIRKRHIELVFKMQKKSLMDCCEHLNKIVKGLKTKRALVPLPESNNLPLLQEVAYLKHRRVIRRLLKYKDDVYKQFKEEARALGILETCGVCEEEELIPEECFNCKKGCVFCKDCVRKYVEVRMGDGFTTFPCCNDCDSNFSLHILQMVIPRNNFERLVLKIQSDEIKQANIDGLETCPFCDFASIPPEESTIFKCENPECSKESCRLCRHESHIPMRCNEIEYDEDVRRRTYIENMMTEALARTCYRCKKKFIKSNGCNKMTCTCGAMMCYLCSQPVDGYNHFGGNNPCQLTTNDAQIDLSRVRREAERAKNALGNVEIKFDPSVGIENYFNA